MRISTILQIPHAYYLANQPYRHNLIKTSSTRYKRSFARQRLGQLISNPRTDSPVGTSIDLRGCETILAHRSISSTNIHTCFSLSTHIQPPVFPSSHSFTLMRFAITIFAALAAALPSANPEPFPQAGAAAGITPGILASGPHKPGFWAEPTLPKHTIFAPIDLATAGKLPVLIWGNGACSSNGTYFRRSLFEVASHGVYLPSQTMHANSTDRRYSSSP